MVSVGYAEDGIGHALNIFETTDMEIELGDYYYLPSGVVSGYTLYW